MNKKNFIIGLLLLFCALSYVVGYEVSYADSGWDTDYDSGSYDSGGYDYDYGDSSYGSSSSSSGVGAVVLLFVIILIVVLCSESMKTTGHNVEDFFEDTENFKLYLPNQDIIKLKDQLYSEFLKIQNAWMEFDYATLRKLCTDELYNSYKTQLEVLKRKNGKNIMSDFALNQILIKKVEKQNDSIILEVYLSVSFYDYVINTSTNKVTRGDKNRLITNNYCLTFIKDVAGSDVKTCPNCGAPIKDTHSSTCEYCNSNIVKKSKKFILSKKNIIK